MQVTYKLDGLVDLLLGHGQDLDGDLDLLHLPVTHEHQLKVDNMG